MVLGMDIFAKFTHLLNAYSPIVKIFFERNFTSIALQFATEYEKDGDILRVSADNEKSNFLVIDVNNKEEALLEYTRMLQEKDHP